MWVCSLNRTCDAESNVDNSEYEQTVKTIDYHSSRRMRVIERGGRAYCTQRPLLNVKRE